MRAVIPRRWLILLAVMLAFLPVVIDMTILHIAVPSLTLALGASVTEVLWIIDIYPLLIAGMLALLGLPLSIGLTASSIAIMGSVEASKGGRWARWKPLRTSWALASGSASSAYSCPIYLAARSHYQWILRNY